MDNLMRLSDAFNGHTMRLTQGRRIFNEIQLRLVVDKKEVLAPIFEERFFERKESYFDEYISPESALDKHWIWHQRFAVKPGHSDFSTTELAMLLPKRNSEGYVQLHSFVVRFQFFPEDREYL